MSVGRIVDPSAADPPFALTRVSATPAVASATVDRIVYHADSVSLLSSSGVRLLQEAWSADSSCSIGVDRWMWTRVR